MSNLKKSSTDSARHPYTRGFWFWGNKNHHFWESGLYSEKAKAYYREMVAKIEAEERILSRLENVKR